MGNHSINRFGHRVTAGLLIVWLLLISISFQFAAERPSEIDGGGQGFSALSSSFDFTPLQPGIEYAAYQPRFISEFGYPKKWSVNDSPSINRQGANFQGQTGLSDPAPIAPSSQRKDIKFFYLATDIPPPFSNS
jgi:hypothetical protein